MSKISLRTYDSEIEALIEQGQRIEEAIAHCAHILEVYPRHLETQRLLAKAYVEAKRHDQAVDSFERVLAAVPEDFVSHVGLSVIAADNGRLDDAIRHMERAFEAQPSNAAIQGELQRLYGRRDGVEPPKVRLTRGALAHMYMEGELYSQAISEAKAVLLNDSERADMESLLAKAYFRNRQDTEAIQVCTELLGRYPYCLEANRLMAAMHMRSGRQDLGEQFRQRLNELDPYAALAEESVLHAADVADSAIILDRLEASAHQAGHGAFERFDPRSESTAVSFDAGAPGRMSDGVPKEPTTTHGSRPTDDIPPFLRRPSRPDEPVESEETRDARTQKTQSTPGRLPDELPPWMRPLALAKQNTSSPTGLAATSDPPLWLRHFDNGQTPAGDRIAEASMKGIEEFDYDLETRGQNVDAAGLDHASGHGNSEDTSIPSLPSTGPQEDDEALNWLNNLSAKYGGESELLLADSKRPESADDPGGTEPEDENAWTPIMEELDAPDWLVDGSPTMHEPPANEGGPVWSGSEPTEINQSVFDEVRESPLEFETIVDYPIVNESLDSAESVFPPEMHSQDEAPPWLRPRAEPEPGSRERARPEDWRQFEPHERWGVDDSAADKASGGPITSGPSPSESSMGVSGMRQGRRLPPARTSEPLERRTKAIEPSLRDEGVVSLGDAQSSLGRGNIAAALDIYGKLIRTGRSLEEIIRDLRDALYRYPVEVPIWQALGDAYMRANRLQEALDAYTKAEELLR